MSDFRLAVDYGTSNTVAVLRASDGRIQPLLFDSSPLMPSAAYLTDDGQLLCGRDAERSARLDPTAFEPHPKRHVGEDGVLLRDRVITPVDLIAGTLRRVGAEAARVAGAAPADLVLTYPAAWGALRRGVLVEAASRAGLPAPTLVPEPVAAAAYFTTVLGHRVAPGHVVVVYDLGAGTLDVSAVRGTPDGFEVLAVDGLPDFGGVDLDAIVVEAARPAADEDTWRRLSAPTTAADRRHFRTLWDDARAAKELLSRLSGVTLHLPLVERDVPIGREDFESRAGPTLRRAAELTARVIERSGASENALAGLFLVGGSSRVPMVASTLHRATGIAPTVLEQPELVVAEGALHATMTRKSRLPAPAIDDQPSTPVGTPTPPTDRTMATLRGRGLASGAGGTARRAPDSTSVPLETLSAALERPGPDDPTPGSGSMENTGCFIAFFVSFGVITILSVILAGSGIGP